MHESKAVKQSKRIVLRHAAANAEKEFLAKVSRSKKLHRPWIDPPENGDSFSAYLARCRTENHIGLFAYSRQHAELAGVININEIVRGLFQSAYLGYYALQPLAGQGYMQEALQLTLAYCFRDLHLHRVEANIQPNNEKSKRLVEGCGFHCEGYSPRYLKIAGRWRDHERWAILVEQWRQRR